MKVTVWYNPRFDLIGLGLEWKCNKKCKQIQIDIKPDNDSGICASWGRARIKKEWQKVDWRYIGEY